MAEKIDPLAKLLDEATPHQKATKMEELFSDRPQVLEAVVRARVERKLSYRQISKVISKQPNISVGEGAVKAFLDRRGIE